MPRRRRVLRRAALGVLALAALALALLAFATWRAERDFARAHPPPGRLILVEGSPIHVIDRSGPRGADASVAPVILFHGNPGTALDFAAVADGLAVRRRSIAVDRPGYGWSARAAAVMPPSEQARRIHAAVIELGVTRPILVGFSYGGAVAIAYALAYPTEVRALVLVAAVASPEEGHRMDRAQALLAQPILGPALAWLTGALVAPGAVSSGYQNAFAPEPVDDAVVARGRLHFARPGCLQASAHDWEALADELPKLAARYGELHLPVELVWSPVDRVVGPAHAAYLAAHVAGTHSAILDGAGHQMLYTRTAEIVAAAERAAARATAAP